MNGVRTKFMRVLTLLVLVTASFLSVNINVESSMFTVPHYSSDGVYVLEGFYIVQIVNDTPYFLVFAGDNFTVFKPNGQDLVSGSKFLGVYPSSLGLVTGSSYYYYVNSTPVMQSTGLFVGGGAYNGYVWAVLKNGSVMVWTPESHHTVQVYGIPKDVLFFNNFTAFVNGSLNYLLVTHVNSPYYREYFFTFAKGDLNRPLNLSSNRFYHVYTNYKVPVVYGFLGGKPYFMGYNITTNETVVFFNGALHLVKGLPVLVVSYSTPFYVVQVDKSTYSLVFANGTAFKFELNGTLRVFYHKSILIYGILQNRTTVVEPFGSSATFNVGDPIQLRSTNTSLVLQALTLKGYSTVLNLSWNSPLRLLGLNYLDGYWVVYFAYPDGQQFLTVATKGHGRFQVPSETTVYPNSGSNILALVGFKYPNSTSFLTLTTTSASNSSTDSLNSVIYYAIAVIIVAVVAYAGFALSRRKR
ncbi:MAG: hypothetical protein ACP5HQ_02395 [Thermoprotei archaeon]